MPFFEYGETELSALRRQAPELSVFIDRFGMIKRETTPDLFTALAQAVISQQISTKAMRTVWSRVINRFGEPSPRLFLTENPESLIGCGISQRKLNYIRGIAQAAEDGLTKESLQPLSDAEICARLQMLDGIGKWMAEMMLIFCFERKNVLSSGDRGIRTALCRLCDRKNLSRRDFDGFRQRFAPYATVASFYLWEFAGRDCRI